MPTFEVRYQRKDGRSGGCTMITADNHKRAVEKFFSRCGDVEIIKMTVVKGD